MNSSLVLYDYAMRLASLPYMWGGDDTIKGFDCSGLVCELLQAAGLIKHKLDFNAQSLHNMYPQKVEKAELGTLAFYGSSTEKISHVGFCLNSYQIIEAGSGDSSTLTLEQAAKQNAFIRIRPINYRGDFLCLKQPTYLWRE